MKLFSLALLLTATQGIRKASKMPTAQETLCAMRRDGKLNLEDAYFAPSAKEHRDGGYNFQALAQGDDKEKKEKLGHDKLDQTAFERHLQVNMGNNSGLVYNDKFQDGIRQPWNPMNTWEGKETKLDKGGFTKWINGLCN